MGTTMKKGVKCIDQITTVGQLRDALNQVHPDTPLEIDSDDAGYMATLWRDTKTEQLSVEIETHC